MVAGGKQCTSSQVQGQPLHPLHHALQIFTDTPKEGWGAHLNKYTTRGDWPLPEGINYQELKAVILTLRVPRPLLKQYCPHSYRQHNSSSLHKQGRRDKVGPLVCPLVKNNDLVYQEAGYSQSLTHPRPAERDTRQDIQAGTDHSNGMVSPSRDLQSILQLVAPTQCGPVCHQIQQPATTVCLPGPRPPVLGSGCTQPVMGGPGSLFLEPQLSSRASLR